MDFLKKVLAYVTLHWVTFLALGMVLWTVDKPYVTAFIANHPFAAALYANIAAVVSFYVKSPTAQK